MEFHIGTEGFGGHSRFHQPPRAHVQGASIGGQYSQPPPHGHMGGHHGHMGGHHGHMGGHHGPMGGPGPIGPPPGPIGPPPGPMGGPPGHMGGPPGHMGGFMSGPPAHHRYQPQWYQQQGPAHSSTYGSYGHYYSQNVFATKAWEATYQAHGGESELWNVFSMEMNKSRVNQQHQAIQAEELHRIMNNTPQIRQYYKINWSMELCKIMLAMMDRNPDGFMQWNEFQEMLQCVYHWYNTFKQFDFDHSGYIEAHELNNVIKSFGYSIDSQVMSTLLRRYSRVVDSRDGGNKCLVAFDDFITLCVRLRAYTDAFRKRDNAANSSDTGITQFTYSDFLQVVMCL